MWKWKYLRGGMAGWPKVFDYWLDWADIWNTYVKWKIMGENEKKNICHGYGGHLGFWPPFSK